MTTLRITTWTMPAADLGPDNPLPALRGERELHALDEGSNVPQEMVDSLIWGHPANILPYTRQDGYNRERRPRDFRVAVLENETLRATFLLELGGRLWSLYHKPSGRELLSVNPVFQPGQPGDPQRMVQRRGRVEHRHHRPQPVHLRAAFRCSSGGAGWACPTHVRMGARAGDAVPD